MRSLKEINYVRLVIGCWYSLSDDLDGNTWYFKFSKYKLCGDIISSECYSPYENNSEIFYSSRPTNFTKGDGNIKKIDYFWMMENIVNGKKIIGG